ncbi:MAG: DUF2007 domain-containing protein [Pseudomonadota bacterium]
MKELLNTNDAVLISYATALLRDAGIGHTIFDGNMSVVEGSIGVLPRRLMVETERFDDASALMTDAGIMPC